MPDEDALIATGLQQVDLRNEVTRSCLVVQIAPVSFSQKNPVVAKKASVGQQCCLAWKLLWLALRIKPPQIYDLLAHPVLIVVNLTSKLVVAVLVGPPALH